MDSAEEDDDWTSGIPIALPLPALKQQAHDLAGRPDGDAGAGIRGSGEGDGHPGAAGALQGDDAAPDRTGHRDPAGPVNREWYWIRVEVGLIEEEPTPEDDLEGIPWYDPPPWFAATYSQACPPSDEPPF